MPKTIKKLKRLSIQPLSIAKFFYEKLGERGVEQTYLQPITYLVYSEMLKKENIVLFKEEFQIGLASPILLSLKDLIKKHGDHLDDFFAQVSDVNNQLVLSYLEKLVKKHGDSFGCEIQYQAQKVYGKKEFV